MCSNYDAVVSTERLRLYFGVDAPPAAKAQVWPLYEGCFIRRHPHKDVGDEAVPPREAMAGLFGLIPHWAGELTFGRRTYNARSETVAEKPSFRMPGETASTASSRWSAFTSRTGAVGQRCRPAFSARTANQWA